MGNPLHRDTQGQQHTDAVTEGRAAARTTAPLTSVNSSAVSRMNSVDEEGEAEREEDEEKRDVGEDEVEHVEDVPKDVSREDALETVPSEGTALLPAVTVAPTLAAEDSCGAKQGASPEASSLALPFAGPSLAPLLTAAPFWAALDCFLWVPMSLSGRTSWPDTLASPSLSPPSCFPHPLSSLAPSLSLPCATPTPFLLSVEAGPSVPGLDTCSLPAGKAS